MMLISAQVLTPGDVPPLLTVDRQLKANGTFMQKVAKICDARDEATNVLLDTWEKPMPSWTDNQRLHAIWYSMFFHCDFGPIMEFMPGSKSRSFFDARGPDGASIFHLIAHHWGISFFSSEPAKYKPVADRWAQLLTEGARGGADLHAKWSFGHAKWQELPGTPLVGFLGVLYTDATIEPPSPEMLTQHRQAWVSALHDADIDLVQYGNVESPYVAHTMQIMCSLTVLRITHGPVPSDWQVWIPHEGDLYAGIFWILVEHPARDTGVSEESDSWDAVKKEDWYFQQSFTRKRRSREQRIEQGIIEFEGTSDVHGDGNPPVIRNAADEHEAGSTGDISSHRPAFSFLHVDFDSKAIYCSLEASKVSIRHAVLPQP